MFLRAGTAEEEVEEVAVAVVGSAEEEESLVFLGFLRCVGSYRSLDMRTRDE